MIKKKIGKKSIQNNEYVFVHVLYYEGKHHHKCTNVYTYLKRLYATQHHHTTTPPQWADEGLSCSGGGGGGGGGGDP